MTSAGPAGPQPAIAMSMRRLGTVSGTGKHCVPAMHYTGGGTSHNVPKDMAAYSRQTTARRVRIAFTGAEVFNMLHVYVILPGSIAVHCSSTGPYA